jgi:hypothetical protein
MTTDGSSTVGRPPAAADDRYSRVRQSFAFRDGNYDCWSGIRLAVFGAGVLGWRLAEEGILSGADVVVLDPGVGAVENQGTVFCRPGVLKVESLRDRCDSFRPGHLTAIGIDVRHASLRLLRDCQLWFDCTDDAALAWRLTELSNGLDRILFRCAVDGTGQVELGRVLCSAGGRGYSCQCCTYSVQDIVAGRRRTPCPANMPLGRQPTLAAGGLAAASAGLALSLAQRLVAGKDVDQVLDHEAILDLSNFQLLHLRVNRSEACLSGHESWEPVDLGVDAESGTLADVFAAAETDLGGGPVEIEPYLHPLNGQATCECGAVSTAFGTDWSDPPLCPNCASPMHWLRETQSDRLTRGQAASRGLLDRRLAALGLPAGALFVARASGRPVRRLLLN